MQPAAVEVVLVEGSLTPSVWLPRGRRRVVPLSWRVQKLIDRGMVVELARNRLVLQDKGNK